LSSIGNIGDSLKPSRYETSNPGQLSLAILPWDKTVARERNGKFYTYKSL